MTELFIFARFYEFFVRRAVRLRNASLLLRASASLRTADTPCIGVRRMRLTLHSPGTGESKRA